MIVYRVRIFWANVARDALELGLDTMFQWVSRAVSRLSNSADHGPLSNFRYALCINKILGMTALNDFPLGTVMCRLLRGLGLGLDSIYSYSTRNIILFFSLGDGMTRRLLRTIDLFSGIGGISLALRDITTTLAYCDVSSSCRKVLQKNIDRKKLHNAPIHSDIRTFPTKGPMADNVDMIVGGFPCVGFSNLGKQEGFEEAQSSLFFEMMRLVRKIQPTFVFMENVPPIVYRGGLDTVKNTLGSMGYDLWWCVIPAYSVGAPQNRYRWFCLAVRRGKKVDAYVLNNDAYRAVGKWGSSEPVGRLMKAPTPNYTARIRMLGNAVVPDCTRLAFNFLFTGGAFKKKGQQGGGVLAFSYPKALKRMEGGFKNFGMCLRSGCSEIEGPVIVPKPNLKIQIDPNVGRGVPTRELTSPRVTKPFFIPMWSTPRTSSSHSSNVCTERTSRDLGTQLRFATSTSGQPRDGPVNPEWVEWLQGYPLGWTSYS
jgi:hypothetical protein